MPLSDLTNGPRHPSASGTITNLSPLANFAHDAPAAVVVFLVALPLCLGIALASGAPLMAGLITGIVGGLVVAWLSGSSLAVSGPAAGLTVIVLTAIDQLGSYEVFLLAVVLSGVMQVFLGMVRAGIIAYYFPSNVIKGLLAAIGIILILKQIPHAIGFDADYEGDLDFFQPDGRNTLTEIPYALGHFHMGAVIIAVVGVLVLVVWSRSERLRSLRWLPGPLVVVAMGIGLNELFTAVAPDLANQGDLLVDLGGSGSLLAELRFPDLSQLGNPEVYVVAATIAAVGSIETLLCIEAMDKLDPFKRPSNTNRELRAQGVGNMIAGALGGIPMTAVIVRGSASVQAGGRTPMAAFLHSVLLLAAVLTIPWLLTRIPLSALAAVLLHVGYKLTPVSLFVRMYRRGWDQLTPFVVTVVAIVFIDLLKGVAIGMACAVFYILRANLATPYFMHGTQPTADGAGVIHIELSENVTFLNKASVNWALHQLPEGCIVEIDGSHATYIDRDVLELIEEFRVSAPLRGIEVRLTHVPASDVAPEHRRAEKRHEVVDAARKDVLRQRGDTITPS